MHSLITTVTPEFAQRLAVRQNSAHPELWNLLDSVCDPELPGVSLWDLGVLRDVQWLSDSIHVVITLTYSGCPAVETMKEDIHNCLKAAYPDHRIRVEVALTPAWTTEALSPQAKTQLKSIHICPPATEDKVECPLCGSQQTRIISQFGSTSCKALYQCKTCSETFDYFKPY